MKQHSELYAGIDLHSRNMVIGIITKDGKRILNKRIPTELKEVLRVLEPYKEEMKGVAVESTFNWYWLVDGLLESGYKTHLANPSAIKQYEGLKHTDDKHDAYWLAHLLSLGILPEGYIYPKETRPVRDLLRCRGFLVELRTSLILSLTSMVERWTSEKKSIRELRVLTEEEMKELLKDDMLDMSALAKRGLIEELDKRIEVIENKVWGSVKLRTPFVLLKTITGVGKILALTIMLEVGTISRFPSVGDFCSYARCVPSQRITNNKKKGKGNRKNGNKYLSWAFAEAAHHAYKNSIRVKRYYQRKASKTHPMVAWRAISNKLARAAFFIMRDEVSFKEEGIFCG